MNYVSNKKFYYYLSNILLLIITLMIITACSKKIPFDSEQFYGEYIPAEQEKLLLDRNTYYFAFDNYNVSNDDVLSIYAHAKRINNSKNLQVRIEGHTDNRGSREYNIALGERRAKAVANILLLKGVDSNKIHIVTYWKEKPVLSGQNEKSWKFNRRVVIVYE